MDEKTGVSKSEGEGKKHTGKTQKMPQTTTAQIGTKWQETALPLKSERNGVQMLFCPTPHFG